DMEPKFCVPEGENGVTAGQLRKIVVKYLNENPEELHLTAGSLVSNALNEAFPVSYKDDGTSYCPE
ncbi:MAG: Rap1a/Tai family immunity protein, partial [Pseudomonadales bacterium]